LKVHCFNTKEAEIYGIEKAILLYNLRFWLEKNRANEKNVYNGSVWTYNSSEAFSELFPYMRSSSIRRWLRELENDDVILSTTEFNKLSFDKTKWYTIPNEFSVDQNDQSVDQNDQSVDQNDQTIPDSKPYSKPYTYDSDRLSDFKLLTTKQKKRAWKKYYDLFIPSPNEFVTYARTLYIWDEGRLYSLKAKYDSWVENEWRDGNDNPILNWKLKLRSTLPYLKIVYK